MPSYEIRVAGPIGPVVASIFPGFTTIEVPTSTVLSGTVADAEELLAVMNLIRAHGYSPFDTSTTPMDRPAWTSDQEPAIHRTTAAPHGQEAPEADATGTKPPERDPR